MCKRRQVVLDMLRASEIAVIEAMVEMGRVGTDEEVVCPTHRKNLEALSEGYSRLGAATLDVATQYKGWAIAAGEPLIEPEAYLAFVEKYMKLDWVAPEAKEEIQSFLVIERARRADATATSRS